MDNNPQLTNVIALLLQGRLSKAIDALENYFYSHPGMQGMSSLQTISNEYSLMRDYWQRGFADDQRSTVFKSLLQRTYFVVADIMLSQQVQTQSFMHNTYIRPRQNQQNWSMTVIRQTLEGFVSDVAMLDLLEGEQRDQQSKRLYADHQAFVANLFDYILTAPLWGEAENKAYIELLLSPTIDSLDQQLILSAITLSAIAYFDVFKMQLLSQVAATTDYEPLRQRALVGWVLAADSTKAGLFPEMKEQLAMLLAVDGIASQLAEMQMQIVYCLDAEKDTKTIHDELLPTIMANNNHFKLRDGVIEESEESSLDEIINPEHAEEQMEQMEQSMQKIIDMHRKGSDIYFGGFSQTKRFPFFNWMSNWFVPFYEQHPGISETMDDNTARTFLSKILSIGAFCDSDKYSFALVFQQVLQRLPDSVKEMMRKGEAVPLGGEITLDDQQQPVFIRRIYLQNLYRFFRLFPQRELFRHPFDAKGQRFLFLNDELYRGAGLEPQLDKVVAFLLKKHQYSAAAKVLGNYEPESHTYQYCMATGFLKMRGFFVSGNESSASSCYSRALELKPNSRQAKTALGRALYSEKQFEKAIACYQELQDEFGESNNYELYSAMCLSSLQRYDEALKLLYRLNYSMPDDANIQRALAWTLVGCGRYDQANAIYEKLLEEELAEDCLNYGYSLWFNGRIADAVKMFRRHKKLMGAKDFDYEVEFLDTEARLLSEHGVNSTEATLMIDAIG